MTVEHVAPDMSYDKGGSGGVRAKIINGMEVYIHMSTKIGALRVPFFFLIGPRLMKVMAGDPC